MVPSAVVVVDIRPSARLANVVVGEREGSSKGLTRQCVSSRLRLVIQSRHFYRDHSVQAHQI